jgi:hypothetical protein
MLLSRQRVGYTTIEELSNYITTSQTDLSRRGIGALSMLSERREFVTKKFFAGLLDTSSCLHDILPEKNDNSMTSKLRHKKLFSPPNTRTEHFKNSTIIYALNNYQ